jgi:hypothetical protein
MTATLDIGFYYLARYDPLARCAGTKVPDQGSNLLDKWLNAIETRVPHAVEEHDGVRYIPYVCLHSANLCGMFESAALEAEHSAPTNPVVLGALPPGGAAGRSIAAQLIQLRDECRMTAEELAGELDVKVRSVYRHFSGAAIPRKRHIRGYERIFSKALKRQVVIEQTSVERQ